MSTTTIAKQLLRTATRSSLPLSTSARLTAARSFHSSLPKMTVHTVETVDQFNEAIAKHPVVVVDWFATWCGPCKAIAPKLAQWSNEKPNVHFIKVDVDALPELAAEKEIKAMPTFHIYKDGKFEDQFVSAVPPKLLALIEKYEPAAEPAAE